ncbi:hypothetical protein AB0407_34495 [Streptomyces microflavus]|uniref:hypothetical protein n=1 Tax=Streptomyces microflavus TaxID=1919 RepID=UPI00344DD87F
MRTITTSALSSTLVALALAAFPVTAAALSPESADAAVNAVAAGVGTEQPVTNGLLEWNSKG